MMKKSLFINSIACMLISSLFFCSCKSLQNNAHASGFGNNLLYAVVSPTQKVFENQFPTKNVSDAIMMHTARRESESSQVVFYYAEDNYGTDDNLVFNASFVPDYATDNVTPEIRIETISTVPVLKPSFAGLHKWGNFQDPIIPSQTFNIKRNKTQSILLTAFVPAETQSGTYSGNIIVTRNNEQLATIPVTINVHKTVLPLVPFLKTRFNKPNSFSEPYYENESWTKEEIENQYEYYMKYFRINTGFKLDWSKVLKYCNTNQESVIADQVDIWADFDTEVEKRMSLGISTFDIPIDVSYDILNKPEDLSFYGTQLAFINKHLKEKGWVNNFIWYNFDEPKDDRIDDFCKISQWAKSYAPDMPILTTLGWATIKYRDMQDNIDIWVPHIHQYELNYFPSRKKSGDDIWIYTCIQTFMQTYPDSWKIDTYGTCQRSLGWWLYKYDISGYLYWAMAYWSRTNPWEDAETFPFGNGDGNLVYPALDKKSRPYDSLRLHNQRDGFEDYDLLILLENALNEALANKNNTIFSEEEITEIKTVLSGALVIPKKNRYTKDDSVMPSLHERILTLLDRLPSVKTL